MSANSVLVRESFSKWFRTKGFIMVLAVGLIPAALTGAWAWTHDADLAVTALSYSPEMGVEAGENVTISATVQNIHEKRADAFNVTIRAGYYQQIGQTVRWNDQHNETIRVDGLAPGAKRVVTTEWQPRQGGLYQVEVFVDFFEDDIPEIEELNNYRFQQLQVSYPPQRPPIDQPTAGNTTNSTLPSAELNLTALDWSPRQIFQNDNITFTITVTNEGPEDVTNVTLGFQVFRLAPTFDPNPIRRETATLNLTAGSSENVTFEMQNMAIGAYAAAAFIDASQSSRDDNVSNNVVFQNPLEVSRRLIWEEPPEKATAKAFYRGDVLLPLHYTLLVPLIGLFFAGGVLHDERQRGNLVYLLTRPIPRWTLPLTRFTTGFLVALVAVLAGVFLTWLLLLGTPQDADGFLWWPLVFGVIVLLLYSAVFTLVGVMSDRPYLVGLLYVLGFETLILAGSRILVNGRPLVQEWLLNFSLMHWVTQAFGGWDPTAGFTLLPQGDEATKAFLVIAGIIVVSLLGSMWAMTRRQFPE